MKFLERALADHAHEEEELLSLCSLTVGDRVYGIDTRSIREVLGDRAVQRVPLARSFVGGILPYRGEVLTAVSFRALLGLPELASQSCVLVLDGEHAEDHFGLMVDRVGGVVLLKQASHTANPSTLDDRGRTLFDGAFRMASGLLVKLAPDRLHPGRLAETALFGGGCATSSISGGQL